MYTRSYFVVQLKFVPRVDESRYFRKYSVRNNQHGDKCPEIVFQVSMKENYRCKFTVCK